jgi:cytochrome c oxidase subunit 2
MWNFPLLPETASTIANKIDALFFFLVAVSLFFSLVITIGLAYSAARYRKGSPASRKGALNDYLPLELLWSLVPLAIALFIFGWSAKLYFDMRVPPANAMEVYVVGKQWMWKIQHPEGNREINELHIPVGRPIKLIMTSQDVIHSFYVPAFRIKQDVLPGRYTTQWFEATKPGEYHLFCAEYCGTSHSGMIGKVIAMDPADYEQWLMGASRSGVAMASSGAELFDRYGCRTCHRQDTGPRGPALDGLWGKQVKLADGKTLIADQEYIRESILNPAAKTVAGYQQLMPSYRNQLTQDQVNQLIEYIRTLSPVQGKQEARP